MAVGERANGAVEVKPPGFSQEAGGLLLRYGHPGGAEGDCEVKKPSFSEKPGLLATVTSGPTGRITRWRAERSEAKPVVCMRGLGACTPILLPEGRLSHCCIYAWRFSMRRRL